jgi:hypothetical protein
MICNSAINRSSVTPDAVTGSDGNDVDDDAMEGMAHSRGNNDARDRGDARNDGEDEDVNDDARVSVGKE